MQKSFHKGKRVKLPIQIQKKPSLMAFFVWTKFYKYIKKKYCIMDRSTYDVAEHIVNRMDKLQKTIFELQELSDKKMYMISSGDKIVALNEGEVATEVFIQGFFEYYIGLLNLELNELKQEFENLA